MDDWAEFQRIYAAHNPDTADQLRYHVAEQLRGIRLEGKSILDVGCGVGFTSLYLALFTGAARVTAVDENQGVGSAAGVLSTLDGLARRLNVGERLRVVEGDVMGLDPGDGRLGQYDVIIANQSIHHVVDGGARYWADGQIRLGYIRVFGHLRGFAVPGGALSLLEVDPLNLWRWVAPGRVFPGMAWAGHPPVSAWCNAMRQGGWAGVHVQYGVPYKLRRMAGLLSNPMAGVLLRGAIFLRGVNSQKSDSRGRQP